MDSTRVHVHYRPSALVVDPLLVRRLLFAGMDNGIGRDITEMLNARVVYLNINGNNKAGADVENLKFPSYFIFTYSNLNINFKW